MSIVEMAIRAGRLVCPKTKMRLALHTRETAEAKMGHRLMVLRGSSSFNDCTEVLVREDCRVAYPVSGGTPVLMVPEMLGKEGTSSGCDLGDPRYAEAYEEMDHYNEVATWEAAHIRDSSAYATVERTHRALDGQLSSFPNPIEVWLDATYDCAAQWDAYNHIAPLKGKRILQLGGKGIHAVKFLIGGADETWLVTPMIGELRCAMALAREFGVADRLGCVVAIGEELPFASNAFDGVYCGGCLHHMVVDLASKEVERVLREGGRFSAVEPWRAPLYAAGTRVFGKREEAVHCRPLTQERVKPMYHVFRQARVIQHGTLTRYPLLALMKLGIRSSLPSVWRINAVDDAVCSCIPKMRDMGSSVACLGTK